MLWYYCGGRWARHVRKSARSEHGHPAHGHLESAYCVGEACSKLIYISVATLSVNNTSCAVKGFGEAQPPQRSSCSGCICRQRRQMHPETGIPGGTMSLPNLPGNATV